MTLLRRAPREVYRVYGEEEFWTRAEQELIIAGGEVGVDVADARQRSFRRVLVSTLLVSAVGAVGVLALTTRAPRASHRGAPATTRLLAAARLLISVRGGRAHPVSAQATARPHAALVRRVLERARTAPPTARTSPQDHLSAPPAPDTPAVPQAAPAAAQATEAPGQPAATSAVETPPRARAAAAAPASQGQSEFGFER